MKTGTRISLLVLISIITFICEVCGKLDNQTNEAMSISCSVPKPSNRCPSNDTKEEIKECYMLDEDCLKCDCAINCTYGENATANCVVPDEIECNGARNFERNFTCQYCYQSNGAKHHCKENFECNSVADPYKRLYRARCKVPDNLICLGKRDFLKLRPCNWTGGYKWSTALALSITLGGFGADRFYLGHWQEGIGKLFSFGGLGVWTLVDVVMVAIGYIGPADGSLYI